MRLADKNETINIQDKMNKSINEYINRGELDSFFLIASHSTLLDFTTSSAYLHELTGEQPSFDNLDHVIERQCFSLVKGSDGALLTRFGSHFD